MAKVVVLCMPCDPHISFLRLPVKRYVGLCTSAGDHNTVYDDETKRIQHVQKSKIDYIMGLLIDNIIDIIRHYIRF